MIQNVRTFIQSTHWKLFFLMISFLSFFVMVFDIIKDLQIGKSALHIFIDLLIAVSIFSFLFSFFSQNKKKSAKEGKQKEISSASIGSKFIEWNLSKAEIQVAELILLGYSYQGIADLLDKSERTVRQQAHSIFAKSGLKSRSMFTGSFIEDLYSIQ